MNQADEMAAALRWITLNPDGSVTVREPSGLASRGTLEPALPRPEDLVASTSHPEPATLHLADGASRNLAMWSPPGVPGAVALDAEAVEGQVGAITAPLINHVAHDVRNLVFTIALQAELGERRADVPPDVKAHLGAVLRQVDALKAYLDRLLLFGRPARLALGEVDVARFLHDVAARFRLGWGAGKPPLALRTELAADCGSARWDADLLAKAIDGLLDNAARAADPPPAITLAARPAGMTVVIEIRDEGTGIQPAILAALATPMAVRRPGGAGLGIAIARKLVAAHGGAFELVSSGHGATARIALPREVGAG